MQRSDSQNTEPCIEKGVGRIEARWGEFERRPTWSVVTSPELARALGVSLQTLANWRLRGILPPPEPRKRGGGNKNRYRISRIRAWLENRPEEDIHWEWLRNFIEYELRSLGEADQFIRSTYKILGVEKPNAPLPASIH
jgi:hypothetical protein